MDDEPNIRWTMAELLRREGYEPLTASDVGSALSVIDQNAIDVAVIDIFLPRQSGIELLKELGRREDFVPVIMITGEPNLSQLPQIVRAGAYDFLTKPVVKDVLLKAVANALDKKRLIDERRHLEEQIRKHAEDLERTVAERTTELVETQKFLKTVLDSLTDYALVAVDNQTRIVLFNRGAEMIFGHKAREVMGKPAKDVMASHYAPEERPFLEIANAATGEGVRHAERELSKVDGSRFTASVDVTPMHKAEGEQMGYLIMVRDLTAERLNEQHLRQLRERLAHQEKIAALGRMAAQVAHEVKNPLAGLHLYAMHLKKKAADKLPANELSIIDKIVDAIHQLTGTVDQVLNFARPMVLNRHRADLNRVVADSLALLEPQLTAKRINVTLGLAGAGAHALLDEATVRSMLINLIINSIQSMTEGGDLLISTATEAGQVQLCVSDTGCGMSEEQMRNIFEPFYTTKSHGLGLGMSFASKVIEQHNGSISVESRVGEGTRIKIILAEEQERANEAKR